MVSIRLPARRQWSLATNPPDPVQPIPYAWKRKEHAQLLQRPRRCRLDQLQRRGCPRCRHRCPTFSFRVFDSRRALLAHMVAIDKENIWEHLLRALLSKRNVHDRDWRDSTG